MAQSDFRDSEESAPAEYPPDQPDVDTLDDDSAAYGAEEVELEAALKKELEELEKKNKEEQGEDQEMEGVDENVSDAESEDLEAESSGSDDEDDDDEAGDDDDEDIEMGDDDAAPKTEGNPMNAQQADVMVH